MRIVVIQFQEGVFEGLEVGLNLVVFGLVGYEEGEGDVRGGIRECFQQTQKVEECSVAAPGLVVVEGDADQDVGIAGFDEGEGAADGQCQFVAV